MSAVKAIVEESIIVQKCYNQYSPYRLEPLIRSPPTEPNLGRCYLYRSWTFQPVRAGNANPCLIGCTVSRECAEISKTLSKTFLVSPIFLELSAYSCDTLQPIRDTLDFPARMGWIFQLLANNRPSVRRSCPLKRKRRYIPRVVISKLLAIAWICFVTIRRRPVIRQAHSPALHTHARERAMGWKRKEKRLGKETRLARFAGCI